MIRIFDCPPCTDAFELDNMVSKVLVASVLVSGCVAARVDPWTDKFGKLPDLAFTGLPSFAHLPHLRCLDHPDVPLDIAVLGIPFDTAGVLLNFFSFLSCALC
jgi:hypothetical protein